ncbi:MAG: DUF1553 domain-containing protein, partial [Planctomycetota bacterium]
LSPGEPLRAHAPEALRLGDNPVEDRLDLARWMTSPDHPLTARVFVNRVWAQLFGAGLVETIDEFGSTGTAPTHPEVLDHLAARFAGEWGWSVKRLLREIVLARTYGRDARTTPAMLAIDANNRLLARGPRNRLTAEMVRDQALVLSGRFNDEQFGPPVKPYQPAGVWKSVWNAATWDMDQNDKRFRRALYVYWKRTAGYPSLMAFDMPSREQCAAKRERTNTPLQALVTLNDPAHVELAEGFAQRMRSQSGASLGEQIAWGFKEATGAPASGEAVAELVALHAAALAAAPPATELEAEVDVEAGDNADADTDAHASKPGVNASDAEADDAPDREGFAMTIVASALMNLDAALTK